MSKRDKLRQRLRNNPKGVRFSDLETLLLAFGFVLVRVSGSHHIFQYNDGKVESILVLPIHGNRVKTPYVRDAIELLDRLFPEAQSSLDKGGDDE